MVLFFISHIENIPQVSFDFLVPFLLKHTLEIEFGPGQFS